MKVYMLTKSNVLRGWLSAVVLGCVPITHAKCPVDLLHARVTCWDYQDQTDAHEDLCRTREWLLGRHEAAQPVRANVLDLCDTLTGNGTVWLVEGPVPYSRWNDAPDFTVSGRGVKVHSNGFPVVRLDYTGGRAGRIRALHARQRQLRPYDPRRDGLVLSNTWGDRHRFERINESDMFRELEAAAALGVDVMEIDAGWAVVNDMPRENITGAGEWQRYWDLPNGCWAVNTNRFPRGLRPLADAARAKGMAFGLWFAPDSSDDSVHWRRDADILLDLWRNEGVRFFKTDFMTTASARGLARQRAFYDAVIDGSGGEVAFDLDITGQVPRPGYFGIPRCALFVENRYHRPKDGRLWWPHKTLRNLWTLAEAVDPVRLRMEFMNPTLHRELYGESPLAPFRWPADTLFATVMAASPLAWMDCVDVQPETAAAWKPLITTWKRERQRWHGGSIIPVGARPDGVSWTGFVSRAADGHGGYALLFRELAAADAFSLDLSGLMDAPSTAAVIAGRGTVSVKGFRLEAEIPAKLDFLWVKLD